MTLVCCPEDAAEVWAEGLKTETPFFSMPL
jgi:hypothetical protein